MQFLLIIILALGLILIHRITGLSLYKIYGILFSLGLIGFFYAMMKVETGGVEVLLITFVSVILMAGSVFGVIITAIVKALYKP